MKYSILATTVVVMLAGCASGGPDYEKAAGEGSYGYRQSQLAQERYRVSFTARAGEQDAARRFALLRAAELTLQKDYDWFQVANRETTVSEDDDSMAGAQVGMSTQTTTNCGLLSCSSTTRPVPSSHFHTSVDSGRDEAVASVEFVMGKGETPDGARYYDAQSLADTIRTQHME